MLALEFDSDLDKLFILTTKKPVTSSIVALCVIDVATDIDQVFDTAPYEAYDIDGKEIQVHLPLFILPVYQSVQVELK